MCTLDDALDDVIDFQRAELAMEAGQLESRDPSSSWPTPILVQPAAPARAA
jgi:hypothetical protein